MGGNGSSTAIMISTKMRILVVTNHFQPEEFRINDLVDLLKSRGHAISVLTAIPDYPSRSSFKEFSLFRKQLQIVDGVKIFRAPLVYRGDGSGLRLALNYLSFAVSASFLGPLFLRGKYDIVFVFESSPVTVGIPAVLMKKLSKCPMVFWVQDLWPETLSATDKVKSTRVLKLVGSLVKYIYKHSELILIQSEAFRQSVGSLAPPSSPISYFPNSAEELYRPVPIRECAEEAAMMPSGFRVVFAGNIGIAQDFETILSAAEILRSRKNIKWVIIGDGSRRSWVASEIDRRNLKGSVHLLGRHPMESMPMFFAMADALLVTLKRDPTFSITVPSKIQSYMACAKPIIGSLDGEGARMIEEAGAGISCPAESPQQLADAVLTMYQSSVERRKEQGRAGRAYFDAEFERNMLVDRLEGWMLELVKKQSSDDNAVVKVAKNEEY
jgi:colanic acid biosynthesis glycosyl transferase WcaI